MVKLAISLFYVTITESNAFRNSSSLLDLILDTSLDFGIPNTIIIYLFVTSLHVSITYLLSYPQTINITYIDGCTKEPLRGAPGSS